MEIYPLLSYITTPPSYYNVDGNHDKLLPLLLLYGHEKGIPLLLLYLPIKCTLVLWRGPLELNKVENLTKDMNQLIKKMLPQ